MHVAMPVALGLVEAHAAREDEIGAGEQIVLESDHSLRGAAEKRQFVHVVVDAQIAFEMAREGDRHRRVVPENPRRRGSRPIRSSTSSCCSAMISSWHKPFGQNRNRES